MEIAKLILDYIKVLIWPLVILTISWRYKRYFDVFLRRLSHDAEEISGLGVTIKVSSNSTSLNKLKEIAKALPASEPQRAQIIGEINKTQLDDFRLLSANFIGQPIEVRRQTADEIAKLAESISLEDLLTFANSPLDGERVGAGIGLKIQILRNKDLDSDDRVVTAIGAGLQDQKSRVRYRFIGATMASRNLLSKFSNVLDKIRTTDNNSELRDLAAKALRELQ